ncbi:MAG: HAD hydrolase family protein [Anaerolineales bacterium]|nr:HAD hydrolase family protein [Anaerolineales bacterium]
MIWSSTRDLDIVPTEAGKGNAIKFIVDYFDLTSRTVIIAGDSGNDRTMFDEFPKGIVVGNAQPELKRLKEENPPEVYFCPKLLRRRGVMEGLQHFGLI